MVACVQKNCIRGTFELYTVHGQSKGFKIAGIWTICIFFVGWDSMREALRPIPMRNKQMGHRRVTFLHSTITYVVGS